MHTQTTQRALSHETSVLLDKATAVRSQVMAIYHNATPSERSQLIKLMFETRTKVSAILNIPVT